MTDKPQPGTELGFGKYRQGQQPCDNFTPNKCEEWFGYVTHCCPRCNSDTGVRMFCLNCCKDHHATGWDTCTPSEH